MRVKAELKRGAFSVSEKCAVEVYISCGRDLSVGDCAELQFPNSWLLVTGPGWVKR